MKPLLALFSFSQLLLLLLLLVSPRALVSEPVSTITLDSLATKIKEVEAATDLDETTRARLIELYRKTLNYFETAASSAAASEAFRQARQSAGAEANEIRSKIEATAGTSFADELQISDQTPIETLEQLLLKEKANRSAVAAKLSELQDRLVAESDRPTAIRKEIGDLTRRQEIRDAELSTPAPADSTPLLAEAMSWLLQSEGRALSAQLKRLDDELLSQPMRIELLKARRDQSTLSIQRIDARIELLEQLLGSRRVSEADQARTETEQAMRETIGKHPLLQDLAAKNALLSEDLGILATGLAKVRADEAEASAQAQRIEADFRSTKQKLDLAGLSQALGQVLLEQRRALPNIRLIQRQTKQLETEIADAGLRQIRDEDERRQLQSLTDYVKGLTAPLPYAEAAPLRSELESLAETRRKLLDKSIANNQFYVRALGELDIAQRQLADAANIYDAFLDERLLWIRSSPAPSAAMLLAMPEQLRQLVAPGNWREVFAVLADEALRSPFPAFGVLIFCLLLWKRASLRKALLASGNEIRNVRTDRFYSTFQALVFTLLMAAPWPLLLATAGWQLALSAETTAFAKAVARGLIWVATAGFYLESFRILCRPGGLAATHFRWPEDSLRQLRRSLNRLMPTMLPAAFVALVVITFESPTMGGGLGRLAFVIVLIALALFFYRLFDPGRGALGAYLERHPRSALTRLRYVWLALAVVLPLVLAGMAVLGFLYTAGTLTGSLIDTLWLILVLVVVQQLVIRWLLLARRRLAYQAALERREAALRAREEGDQALPAGSESIFEQMEEPVVDLNALSEDSRKLLNMVIDLVGVIGIWLIWSPVLPAFGVLDDISLWHHMAVVEGQERLVPVTLADVLLALLVVILTVLATKRLPALLEIALLPYLKMSQGGRYATTTLSRYVIVAAGMLFAFSSIGASWSSIQWLVAALGVGIGFGLQEIVANFISGIIILFERPIRVGDTVTVGDTDGVVTRIQIRATTIRNWDGKELLVPNKEFITARLLNWTLSDALTRMVIPVGLAYGGDVGKAMALLLEAANEHPRVLPDPRPSVVFDAFGDNALSLKLRCFVGSMEYRIETISELHEAINSKFNAAGLVIAFPQRDVHLDTSRPLDIRIRREQPGEAGL